MQIHMQLLFFKRYYRSQNKSKKQGEDHDNEEVTHIPECAGDGAIQNNQKFTNGHEADKKNTMYRY